MDDAIKLKVTGHLFITDKLTGEVLLDQDNSIHFENMSFALAKSLGNDLDVGDQPTGPIRSMVFGNGGSTVNGVGAVTYLEPNTNGATAALYNETFSKIVDDENVNNLDVTENKITVDHVSGNLFSDIVITATLGLSEPAGQDAFDTANNSEDAFVFDEIGIKDYTDKLIAHIIFHPLQKALSRIIELTYTIRIQLI